MTVKTFLKNVLLVSISVTVTVPFCYWLFVTEMKEYWIGAEKPFTVVDRQSGDIIVGIRNNPIRDIAIWRGQKNFFFLRIAPDGAVVWNMTMPDGSEVFDWNGDGLIDERPVRKNGISMRYARLDTRFAILDSKDGKFFVGPVEVVKVDGEWKSLVR
jgi:hypothetical protein